MYDCVLGRQLDEGGRALAGCILAHSMGLGKSLTTLALLHTLLKVIIIIIIIIII